MFFYKLKDDCKYFSISLQGVILYRNKWLSFIKPINFNGYEKYIENYQGEKAKVISKIIDIGKPKKELNIYKNKNKKIKKEKLINTNYKIEEK